MHIIWHQLPNIKVFVEKIAELEAAGVTIKDDVAREITEKGL